MIDNTEPISDSIEMTETTIILKGFSKVLIIAQRKFKYYLKTLRNFRKGKKTGKVIHSRGNSLTIMQKSGNIKPFSVITVKAKEMKNLSNDFRSPRQLSLPKNPFPETKERCTSSEHVLL